MSYEMNVLLEMFGDLFFVALNAFICVVISKAILLFIYEEKPLVMIPKPLKYIKPARNFIEDTEALLHVGSLIVAVVVTVIIKLTYLMYLTS